MDQETPGTFIAHMNAKKPGDGAPDFTGHLTLPGRDHELPIGLWAQEFVDLKSGKMHAVLSGQAGTIPTGPVPLDQVTDIVRRGRHDEGVLLSPLNLGPSQLVLFDNNGFKPETHDKGEPDMFGIFNSTGGLPMVRLNVWIERRRHGLPTLHGETMLASRGVWLKPDRRRHPSRGVWLSEDRDSGR